MSPPMVGVPCLTRWISPSSSRMGWPSPLACSQRIRMGVPTSDTRMATAPASRRAITARTPGLARMSRGTRGSSAQVRSRSGDLSRDVPQRSEHGERNLSVVEGQHLPRHLLALFVALAGDDDDVARPRLAQRELDGGAAVDLD